MNLTEEFLFWQTAFAGCGVFFAALTAYLAFRIGKRQNQINEMALRIGDYAEIFLMPQHLFDSEDKNKKPVGHNILIKNISSYPIYLISYKLNDKETIVGSCPIPPHGSDNWYAVRIPSEVNVDKKLVFEVRFETYLGSKFMTLATGDLSSDGYWVLNPSKKVALP